MFFRAMTLAGGLGAAQFPAYSQQYMQRLGGAVDALHQVVADFDASAAAEGLTRQEALAQMQGTDFVERRRADMTHAIDRYETLRTDLVAVQGQGPFMRAYRIGHLIDAEIAKRAWQAFQPALPLSLVSLLFAAIGFVFAAAGARLLLAAMRALLRRKPLPA